MAVVAAFLAEIAKAGSAASIRKSRIFRVIPLQPVGLVEGYQ